MKKVTTYDAVVIGAGSAGLTAAIGLSRAGKKVLLIEKNKMGGDCTNVGCIPSKSLIHRANTYNKAKTVAGETSTLKKYKETSLEYVRNTVDKIQKEESPEVLKKYGVTTIKGEAEFTAPCVIKVNETQYKFKKAIIATGSSPKIIDIEGLEKENILTNENIFELIDIPEKLLIVGSGPIGMELGQAFAMLGSKVTIVTKDNRLAGKEDPDITHFISNQFTKLNIDTYTEAEIEKVEAGQALIKQQKNSERISVPYDKVLLAIGRTPNLPRGLEVAKVTYTSRGITIDEQYRATNKSIYAAGDVSLLHKFTHTAGDSARNIVGHILSKGWLRGNSKKSVPKVTYTSPEIAQVGISYEEARSKYGMGEIMRIVVPYAELDRAITDGETEGLAVVTAKRLTGKIIGANIVGKNAGEIIAVFTLAIDTKMSLWRLRNLIYAYPTYMLLIQKVGDYFLTHQLKNLKKDIYYKVKKHSPKIIAFLFWLTLIVSFQHYKHTNDLSYKDMLYSLYEFFTMSMFGPFIYVGLYAIRPLILFPATLLTALSGVLFGFWWGVAYTILGENASANFAYWIGRFFGNDLKLEEGFLGKHINWLRTRPFESVLFMRLFYVPFDLTNYGSGILKVSWRSYFFATLIGIMPGLTVFVALGAAISIDEYMKNGLTFDAFEPKFLATAIIVFVVSILLSKLLKLFKTEV